MRAISLILVIVSAYSLSACATATVQQDALQDARTNYPVVVVGEVNADDELWGNYAILAKRSIVEKLTESGAFMQVIDELANPLPANALIVTATITEADRGNAASRALIGFGAGRAHITSEVELSEANGTELGNFLVRRAYSGGIGIGGFGLLDMEELAQLAGEEAADTIVSWTMTGALQSSE